MRALLAGLALLITSSAIAEPKKYLILPPVEYDHAYKGMLIVETVATREELRTQCGAAFGPWTLGCAWRSTYPADSCRIIMVDEKVMKAFGWRRDMILRHEIGHCNGWPGDHPGQRNWDAQ